MKDYNHNTGETLTKIENEAVTINTDGYYRTVTLIRHENIDCPNLTQNEFIELMQADLEKALDEYKNIIHAENDLWHISETGIFFDFKPNVTEYIPGVCILHPGDDDNKLARCFEEHVNSKWWKKATGWVFKYMCGKDSLRYSFRPRIELIMDESSSAERKREEKALDDAILS